MSSREFQQFMACVVLSVLSCACGSKKTTTSDDNKKLQRAGSPLQATKPQFIDYKPKLSSDGSRVVLISGRESTDSVPVFKAFKATWPDGDKPSELSRVTADNAHGDEKEAVLSADGKLVALTTMSERRAALVLVSFDDASKVQRLGDEAAFKERPSFSPDSKLLAWIAHETAADGSGDLASTSLKVADVSGGIEVALPAAKVASLAGSKILDAFWVPAESGYKLAMAVAATDGTSTLQYRLLEFASLDAMQPQAATDWVGAFQALTSPVRAASATKALFGRRTPAQEQKRAAAAGDVGTPPFTATMVSDAWMADVSSASVTATAAAKPAGYELLAADVAKDGQTFFMVVRNAYRCDAIANGAISYGSSLAVAAADGSAVSLLSPRVENAQGDFAMAKGFCDRTPPQAGTIEMRLDDKIFDASVNGDALASKYRIAYVSRFSPAIDANCQMKIGDPEVMLVDFDGSAHKILALSKNSETLVSDVRPEGATPCP